MIYVHTVDLELGNFISTNHMWFILFVNRLSTGAAVAITFVHPNTNCYCYHHIYCDICLCYSAPRHVRTWDFNNTMFLKNFFIVAMCKHAVIYEFTLYLFVIRI